MRVLAIAIVMMSVHVAGAGGSADKPWAAGVSEAEQTLALSIYKEGNAEFEESRYAQALTKYREAVKHWDHPAIRFNMAVSLVNLDQPLEAYDALEHALKYGDAPLGADAYAQGLTYKKLLEGQLTHLRVTSDIPGAEVSLDGKPLLSGPGDVTQLLTPGAHQLVASKAGFLTETTPLVLLPGKETSHAVKLLPLKVSTKLVRRWKASTPWLVVGLGAGLVAVGGVAEYLAHQEYATYDQLVAAQCPNGCGPMMPDGMTAVAPSTQSHKTTGLVENVAGVSLLAVGGSVAIAGLVGVYLNQPRSVIEHGPTIAPMTGATGVSARWSF